MDEQTRASTRAEFQEEIEQALTRYWSDVPGVIAGWTIVATGVDFEDQDAYPTLMESRAGQHFTMQLGLLQYALNRIKANTTASLIATEIMDEMGAGDDGED